MNKPNVKILKIDSRYTMSLKEIEILEALCELVGINKKDYMMIAARINLMTIEKE